MRGILASTCVLTLVLLTAACGVPPDLQSKGDKVPEASAQAPPETTGVPPGFTPRPAVTATPSPTAAAFPEYTAVDCAGRPTKEQVIAVVRRETSINPGEVLAAPVCAGTWQYTVLAVPGNDAVQVLTKTTPSGLALVTAGTDVCSLEIEHQAPSGILFAAGC